MVTANISYGTLLAAPTLDTLNAILTYSALQSDPPEFATNGNSGWVAGQVPNGWTLGPVSGTSIVLVRTNVAPGTPIGVMNFAARGTGSSTLTAVTYMGTAGGVPFSKSFAVTP